MRRSDLLKVLLVSLAFPAAARPPSVEAAAAAWRAGLDAYHRAEYRAALQSFQRASVLVTAAGMARPSNTPLWLGLCHAGLGDCGRAITEFQEIDRDPSVAFRSEHDAPLYVAAYGRCGVQQARALALAGQCGEAEALLERLPLGKLPEVDARAAQVREACQPSLTRARPWALVGTGVALLGTAAGMAVFAADAADEEARTRALPLSSSLDEPARSASADDSADRKNLGIGVAAAAGAVGLGLLIWGIVDFDRDPDLPSFSAGATVTSESVMGTFCAAF